MEVDPVTNVRIIFVSTKLWEIFKLSHRIVMGGGAVTMFNQIFSLEITRKHTIYAYE